MKYELPAPVWLGDLPGYTADQMHQAYAAGAASRDAEIQGWREGQKENLKNQCELQDEVNALRSELGDKINDIAELEKDLAALRMPLSGFQKEIISAGTSYAMGLRQASTYQRVDELTKEFESTIAGLLSANVSPTPQEPVNPMRRDVDWLSNVIRTVNGNHTLGAGALAEAICSAIAAAEQQGETK